LVIFLMQAAAFLFAGRVLPSGSKDATFRRAITQIGASADASLNCALRC
jgi:hypothetical protein